MIKNVLLILIVIVSINVNSFALEPKYELSGYLDTYIATDNSMGSDTAHINYKRFFAYNNTKKDEFAISTAQISAKISIPDFVRSNITFHFGDLQKSAWTAAGAEFPFLQQANAGIRVFDKIWVDAGYFLTHIGSESVLIKDNWLTSHSLVTYYEPFYQSGARVSYESEKITAQLHILNGNGIFEDNNSNKSVGICFIYNPIDFLSLSYAGIYGNEEAGNTTNYELHQLHNFLIQVNLSDKLSLKGQFDYASKKIPDPNNSLQKITGSFIGLGFFAHYKFNEKFNTTFRVDYINNSDGIYSTSVSGYYLRIGGQDIFVKTNNGVELPVVSGMDYTLGIEFKPTSNTYLRLEGRNITLDNKYKIFGYPGDLKNSRNELLLNFGIWTN